MIARRSLPEKSKGVGYYFYETTTGYYFRSWQNMITNQGNFARPQTRLLLSTIANDNDV